MQKVPDNSVVHDQKVSDPVGFEPLSSYTVLSFPGPALPESYKDLIYAGWLKSYRFGNDYFKLIDPDHYYAMYPQYIARTLGLKDTTIRLGVLTDDRDVVLGFSVSRQNILDYIYVNKPYRRTGIGTKLLPENIDTFTHLTRTALTVWGSKYGKWKFKPFA